MEHEVVKFSIGAGRADEQLAYCITQAIPAIGGAVRVAGIRRLSHQNAEVLNVHRSDRKLDHGISAVAVIDDAIWECDPGAERGLLDVVFARPVLDYAAASIWVGPSNPDRVERARSGKVNKNPLGMKRIVFACVWLCQIWIALPIRIQIAVGESRIANHICTVVVSDAAMRQRISVRMADGLTERCAAREITFTCSVAPSALGIPVPRFNVQLRVLAIADRLPTGG